ncbi:imelysin family protein [Teichococcus aerofrigidensis]
MRLTRRHLLPFAAVLLVPATPHAAPDEAAYRGLNRGVVEQVLLPSYRAFLEAAANLAARLDTLARTPGEAAALEAARGGFAAAMRAWQGIQHVRVGPADLFSRHARIQFWPDPRNSIGRDLAEAIAQRDAAVLEVRPNALRNVTLQGLPALEWLIHGDEAVARLRAGDAEAAFRIALLRSIGGNLSTLAADMLAGWTGGEQPFAAALIQPATPYATPLEATQELFKMLHAAVEVVADRKLTRALGAGPPAARPQLLESWRSGLSGQNIQANLAAARAMYRAGFAQTLEGAGEGELATLLGRAFDQVMASAEALPLPLEEAIGDAARRPAVERLRQEAVALKALLAQRLAPALGIPLGFNALDGD